MLTLIICLINLLGKSTLYLNHRLLEKISENQRKGLRKKRMKFRLDLTQKIKLKVGVSPFLKTLFLRNKRETMIRKIYQTGLETLKWKHSFQRLAHFLLVFQLLQRSNSRLKSLRKRKEILKLRLQIQWTRTRQRTERTWNCRIKTKRRTLTSSQARTHKTRWIKVRLTLTIITSCSQVRLIHLGIKSTCLISPKRAKRALIKACWVFRLLRIPNSWMLSCLRSLI